MITAEEVINRINLSAGNGKDSGLKNTQLLLESLSAYPSVPVIHIAGTNGKGSTCAMLNRILTVAGYRTGMYSSPFLQIYNERIRINGVPVSDSVIKREGNILLQTAEQLSAKCGVSFTPFELGTALALMVFREEKTDVQVIETGLGGRLDPTNAIENVTVSGLTAIGMDHMHLLGNTIEEIATEKAGIIRTGTPVVCHPSTSDVERIFVRTARKKDTCIVCMREEMISDEKVMSHFSTADFRTDYAYWPELTVSLPGRHQLTNALTVLGIIDQLRLKGIDIPDEAVREGMRTTVWPARLEWHNNILMDGAHNEQGMHALAQFVREQLTEYRKVLLTGVLTEKLSDRMIAEMSSVSRDIITVTPHSPRAMKADELKKRLEGRDIEVTAADSIESGLTYARELAGENGIVIATGSLYFVGELRSVLGLKP